MSERNDNYFNEMENYCFSALTELNKDLNIWNSLTRTEKYSCIDASGITEGGCKCLIELKARTGDTHSFNDLFIESKKVAYLLLGWVTEGFVPLYINYVECDTEHLPKKVLVWRLDKLSTFNYHPWTATWSDGYKKVQKQERFGLSLNDATLYELDEQTNKYILKRKRDGAEKC